MTLSAPFPWFGGKSRIAADVWPAFGGDCVNYVEPFFGSGAVLLARPEGFASVETVNDADGLLANFWRATRFAPKEVAYHADWPVNECDLHARHLWLLGQRDSLTERLMADDDFFDAKAAGWWVWGCCLWIGGGWCSGEGPWIANEEKSGLIHRKLPHAGNAGRGIHRKLPHAGSAGIDAWFSELSSRLRLVRVACGDWKRVTGPSVTHRHGLTAVFLDPPYGEGNVTYAAEDKTANVAADVRAWAEEMGERPDMRIVLCGYDGKPAPRGFRAVSWKARGGYGSQGDGAGRANSAREMLWLSPACVRGAQIPLFAEVGQ